LDFDAFRCNLSRHSRIVGFDSLRGFSCKQAGAVANGRDRSKC
jgi:hypothetical protein